MSAHAYIAVCISCLLSTLTWLAATFVKCRCC